MSCAIPPLLIAETERFVKGELASVDGSHDFSHIDRVRRVALDIGKAEEADLAIVELAALLHDVKDYKYSGSEEAGPAAVKDFLQRKECPADVVSAVVQIVEGIGFKKSLPTSSSPNGTQSKPSAPTPSLELAVVQDADRLDAIGAIGIARCFTFGGARHRPILEHGDGPRNSGTLTADQYSNKSRRSTVAHFFDKLLLLKDRMNTCQGRRIALERHSYMLDFLSTIGPELGAGDLSSPYRIPIVDLSLPDAPSRLVTACRTWGSFVAINGGVPTSYQSDLLSLARAFFSLDNATKRTLDVGQSGVAWRGYVPPGVESMDGKMELKEGLYVGPEHGPEHPRVKASTPFYGPNQFPDTTLPGLRPAALNYIEAVTDLGGRFMDLLSIGLGLPTQTLREAFKHDDPVTLLGLFSYPPARKVTKTGTGEHTDYGLWTIISADASGMAYWNEEVGVWGEVPHIPGSIICNVGDLLDRATHGLLPSPPHRVLNLSPHTRIAIPLFFDPSWSTEVTPLPLPPSLLGEAADPKRRAAAEKRWAGTSVGEMKGKYAAFLTRNG